LSSSPVARAPGKVVISGAYAVLEGAPAIVSAVDRYVVADARRPPGFLTPEVHCAIGDRPAPWFDASALREREQKLGLGSSAAILVASLAALELAARAPLDDAELVAAVLSRALAAHAEAQAGGSGIDVAASAHGGTLICQRRGELLEVRPAALPPLLNVEVWAAGQPASTLELRRKVSALAERDPLGYRRTIEAQTRASERAADALIRGDGFALIQALCDQRDALGHLGDDAGAPIVTPEIAELSALARKEGAAVLPAGAGGGDVALFVGVAKPSAALSTRALELGQRPVALELGARGVHGAADPISGI
jgi:phosphomevalonate kinase